MILWLTLWFLSASIVMGLLYAHGERNHEYEKQLERQRHRRYQTD